MSVVCGMLIVLSVQAFLLCMFSWHLENSNIPELSQMYRIALIFQGSKFSRFSQILCRSQKYFNKNFATLHHRLLLQRIREKFSNKIVKRKTAIRKNLDPQKLI